MKKHCSSSVNKQQEAFRWKLQKGGMQHWLWQLSPQGGGLSHKLIERSHMIGEFHLEPSRYIKPHRNEEFTEVPPPLPQESPNNLCDCNTLPTAAPPTYAPPSLKLLGWQGFAHLRSITKSVTRMRLPPFGLPALEKHP